jgi:hypothetical protein
MISPATDNPLTHPHELLVADEHDAAPGEDSGETRLWCIHCGVYWGTGMHPSNRSESVIALKRAAAARLGYHEDGIAAD